MDGFFVHWEAFGRVQKISREVLHQVQNKPENAHYCTKGLRLHEIRQL